MQQTSIFANKLAETTGLKEAHKAKIVEALRHHGSMSAHRISAVTGIDATAVSRRISEIDNVADSGTRGTTPSGRPCIIWKIVDVVANEVRNANI